LSNIVPDRSLDRIRKDRVKENDAIFGVADDILNLKQTRVYRVQHAAGTGDNTVKFKVSITVSRQRRGAFATANAKRVQGVRDPFRALRTDGGRIRCLAKLLA
jgi:hypothetical protein